MIEVKAATPTERKVAEMLLENTGAAMMDSGGIYGRAWQLTRTQYGLDGGLPNSTFHGGPGHRAVEPSVDEIERVALIMREQPAATIDKHGGFTIDTFHFLVEHLDYDPDLDAKYKRWERVTNLGKDSYDKDWGLALIERFADQLEARGIYGDGSHVSENSYNGECALDRTIQYTLLTVDEGFLPEGSYVILQIHGGADVRGGYTDPVLFAMSDEYGITDYARGSLFCSSPDTEAQPQHRWESENGGYTFNLDGMWGQGATTLAFDSYSIEKDGAVAPVWDEAHEHWHCPLDGTRLEASPY